MKKFLCITLILCLLLYVGGYAGSVRALEPVITGGFGYDTMAYGNGVYVSVGQGGGILYSNDLTNWGVVSAVPTDKYQSVIFDGERFVTLGNQAVLTSADGESWTRIPVDFSGAADGFTFLNGVYFTSVMQDGGQTIYYSDDLSNLQKNALDMPVNRAIRPSEDIYRMGYHNGIYYAAVAKNAYRNTFMCDLYSSPDLVTWTLLKEDNNFVPMNGSADFPILCDPDYTEQTMYEYRNISKNNLFAVSDQTLTPIVYEKLVPSHIRKSRDYFYTITTSETDGITDTTVWLSKDGIYWKDIVLPYHLMNVDDVFECNDDLIISAAGYALRYKQKDINELLGASGNDQTYIKVRGEYLGFDTPPATEADRTLVPMRFLFEKLEAQVDYDLSTRTATATRGSDVISFSIDNQVATVNGSQKQMDVPARLINDKTMVPLRFLSEELGYDVEWDQETHTAEILIHN